MTVHFRCLFGGEFKIGIPLFLSAESLRCFKIRSTLTSKGNFCAFGNLFFNFCHWFKRKSYSHIIKRIIIIIIIIILLLLVISLV
jgi:hypothetical protein